MTVLYADTSALVRAYVADEPDHRTLRALLLEGEQPVVTSEVARLEFRGALFGAGRAGRLDDPGTVAKRFDADCGPAGTVHLIALEPETTLTEAALLVERHPLRSLDALHLAVALAEADFLAPDSDLVFVTRDHRQASAARSEGVAVV